MAEELLTPPADEPEPTETVETTEAPAETPEPAETPAEAPVEQVETPADEQPAALLDQRVVYAPEPDDFDKEAESAIEDIKNDDMLSPGQKRAELLRIREMQDQRRERRQQRVETHYDRTWNTESKRQGIDRPKLESIWNEERTKLARKYPNADITVALNENYAARVAVERAKKPPIASGSAPSKSITPGGGRVLPRQNRHTPPPPKSESAAEKVARELGPVTEWKV